MEKEQNVLVDQVKSYAFNKSTKDCGAADDGMWLTYSSHLEKVLDCQKRIKYKVQALELKHIY